MFWEDGKLDDGGREEQEEHEYLDTVFYGILSQLVFLDGFFWGVLGMTLIRKGLMGCDVREDGKGVCVYDAGITRYL